MTKKVKYTKRFFIGSSFSIGRTFSPFLQRRDIFFYTYREKNIFPIINMERKVIYTTNITVHLFKKPCFNNRTHILNLTFQIYL